MKNNVKILNIEDTIGKHWDINRALEWNGYPQADLAVNAEEGIRKIEDALAAGEPYHLLIIDMHFSVNGKLDMAAGTYVLMELKKRKIEIPTILCSSRRYKMPELFGCVFYNSTRDLNWDFKEFLDVF